MMIDVAANRCLLQNCDQAVYKMSLSKRQGAWFLYYKSDCKVFCDRDVML